MARLGLLFIFLLGGLRCAQQEDLVYQGSFNSFSPEAHRANCSYFRDDTFYGEVEAVFSASGQYDSSCVEIRIFDSPERLFEIENLFVQAYPFRFEKEKEVYGLALNIDVYEKGYAFEEDPLFSTKIIDSHSVETISSSSTDFFRDHEFKFCVKDLTKWDAMQLVVYFESEEESDAYGNGNGKGVKKIKHSPIRITRFLIPPFLSHPTYFQKEEGNALAIYHPFLSSDKKEDLASSYFVEQAQAICE